MTKSIKRTVIDSFHKLPRPIQKGAASAFSLLPLDLSMGKGYAHTRRLLKETREFDRERLREFQFERFQEVYRHAIRNIPFYKNWYGEHGLNEESVRSPGDIASLPLLSKSHVRKHLEEMTWPEIPGNKRRRCKTGGTTGEPVVVHLTRFNIQSQYAFMHNIWSRVGYKPRDLMLSFCRSEYSRPRDGLLQFYNPKDNVLCVSLDFLNPGTVAQYAALVHEMRPDFLLIYSSTMFIFSQLLREAGISLPPMKAVLIHAQKQLAGQREIIEETLGCPVFLHYGQAERVILASPCEFTRDYHVVPEYGWTELIDENDRPIEDSGRVGELVGTGFFNRVMPLIRYRTGDLALWRRDQSCPCGRPHDILAELKGRTQHFLVLADGSFKGTDPGVTIFSLFAEYGRGFQLVQEVPGKVTVRLAPLRSNPPDYQEKIRPRLQKQYFGPMEFEIVETEDLELTASGKPKFLIQRLKSPGENDASITYWKDEEDAGAEN